jgi:uncharacterized protein (DUF305 family)
MDYKNLVIALLALIAGLLIGIYSAPWYRMQHGGMMQGMNHPMGQGMQGGMMGGMNMGEPRGDQGEASRAFARANADMHTGMDIDFTGNADVDFAKGMVPHHQGAIDMARIVLKFGKDAEIRKLAEGIVAAQESEIAFMNDWLKKNAK